MDILLVEDLPQQRLALESLLLKMGHAVRTASEGARALDLQREFPSPLIISDWQMPDGMDGLELCRAVRARASRDYTYFILLTARHTQSDIEEAMAAGVDDFIWKENLARDLHLRLLVAERILGFRNQFMRMAELVPICSTCHRVRQDREFWTRVETFIEDHLHRPVSHGMCPDCLAAAVGRETKGKKPGA